MSAGAGRGEVDCGSAAGEGEFEGGAGRGDDIVDRVGWRPVGERGGGGDVDDVAPIDQAVGGAGNNVSGGIDRKCADWGARGRIHLALGMSTRARSR